MLILAHFGHWLTGTLLYALPVLLVGGGIWFAGHKLGDEELLDHEGKPLNPPDLEDDELP